MYEKVLKGFQRRGLPEMNSCITGFIQYSPTKNITNKLTKSNAPPNKNVWSFEELTSEVLETIACKFWFIFRNNIIPSYKKTKRIDALTGKIIGSFYFFKIWKKFIFIESLVSL